MVLDYNEFLIVSLVGSLVIFIVYALFLRHLKALMKVIRPESRKLNPDAVWPMLVLSLKFMLLLPFSLGFMSYRFYEIFQLAHYGLTILAVVYLFYIVIKISDSIKAAFHSQNISQENMQIFPVGIWMCISYFVTQLNTIPYLISFIPSFKIFNGLSAVAYVILFITYWFKTSKVKHQLGSLPNQVIDNESIFKNL